MAMRGILVVVACAVGMGCASSETGIIGDTFTDTIHDPCADGSPDTGHDPVPDPTYEGWPDTPPDIVLDVDIPEVEDDAAVAVLEGDPVVLDDETHAGGQVAVEWNGSGWGVVWGDLEQAVFRPVDATAHPTGPPMDVSGGRAVWYISLAWSGDRYGLAFSTSGHTEGEHLYIATVDEDGRILEDPELIASESAQPHVAWSEPASEWLLGYYLYTPEGTIDIQAASFTATASLSGGPVPVAMGGYNRGPRIVPLKSLVSLVWPDDSGVLFRSFFWPDVGSAPGPTRILSMTLISDAMIDATGFFDYTLAVAMDGSDVVVVVVEPWWGSIVSGPQTIGHSGIRDRRPGITAVHDRGYLGVCYEKGPGPWGGSGGEDGVAFRLISPYGEPIGAEVEVISGLRNIGDCEVGWSGSEFLVAYWSCAGDTVWNKIYAQRVRPLI
jgi:hypothetical protein